MTKRIGMTAIALVVALFINTTSFAQSREQKSIKRKNEPSTNANAGWRGKYYGITPCPSCDGIETTLTLAKDNTFRLTTLQLPTQRNPETLNGKFKWKKNKIVLQTKKTGSVPTLFKVEKNQITQLDKNGNELKSENGKAYILKKMGNTTVEDKRWKLIELNGKPVAGTAQSHYVQFHSATGMLEAKAGCNQLTNVYIVIDGSQLTIKDGISTLMACPDDNIEQEFLKALSTTDNLSVTEKNLSLNKGRMAPLARFELVAE